MNNEEAPEADTSLSSPEQLKEEGLKQFKLGNRPQALAAFQEAAGGLEGDLISQAEMYNNIGVIQRMDRRWQLAEEALLTAAALFEEAGDDLKRAQVLGNLGDLSANRRDYDKAQNYYSESSALFSASSSFEMQADVLRALAIMQIRQRKWWSAVDSLNRSLEVRPRTGIIQKLLSLFLSFALKIFSGGA